MNLVNTVLAHALYFQSQTVFGMNRLTGRRKMIQLTDDVTADKESDVFRIEMKPQRIIDVIKF